MRHSEQASGVAGHQAFRHEIHQSQCGHRALSCHTTQGTPFEIALQYQSVLYEFGFIIVP